METKYIGSNSVEFKAYTDEHKAELRAIDGHFRWVITREDGTEYIVRPLECKL
jgi:hypothetical protein